MKSSKNIILAAAALVLAISLARPASAQSKYQITTFDHPLSNYYTFLYGLTDSGTIAGTYYGDNGTQSFTLRDGFVTAISPPLGAQYVSLGGINDAGVIVGRSELGGFQLKKGSYSPIAHPLAYPGFTFPEGIATTGTVVGEFNDFAFGLHGFALTNGVYTTIDPPWADPGYGTWVYAANAAGSIVGYAGDSNFVAHGFVLRSGVFTQIDHPDQDPTIGSGAFGINDAGTIVGIYLDSDFVGHGYVLQDGVFTTLDPPGSLYTVLYKINNAGTIVGYYYGVDRVHGFIATPIH